MASPFLFEGAVIVEPDLEARVSIDPGDPAFAELADAYRRRGDYQGALDLCFNGLTANPGCLRGRVVLARLFYERLHFPLAVRELLEVLRTVPGNPYARKLLQALAPTEYLSTAGQGRISSDHSAASEVIAEAEFDLSSLDLFKEDP